MKKLILAVAALMVGLSMAKGWSSDWKDAKPSKYTPEGGMTK